MGQTLTLHVLEHQVGPALGLSQIVEDGDVGVGELRDRAGLDLEAPLGVAIAQ